MKLPKRGEKGFTLVELLIVLAILAVLAAVVIPNVTGMFGRGAEQAYDTDLETIQMSASTFYFDIHNGPDVTGWTVGDGTDAHLYPTSDGAAGTQTATTFASGLGTGVIGDLEGVIWMGLRELFSKKAKTLLVIL